MPVKKFGIQHFLNHVQSGSSGWVKFAIKPEYDDGRIGFQATATLADCVNKIDLEFEPRTLYPNRSSLYDGNGTYDRQRILRCKKSIRHRRQKVDRFRNAVVRFCNAMDESLDNMERDIDAIPPTLIYDSRKDSR